MVLFLLLLASCTPKQPQWKLTTIKAIYPCSTYAKARLAPCNPFYGIEAEILCNGDDTTFFLNALIMCFPPAETPDGKINVTLEIDENTFNFASERLEGGQRIMLPEEAKELIIASLLDGHLVTITVGRYQTTLILDNFENVYGKMLRLSARQGRYKRARALAPLPE